MAQTPSDSMRMEPNGAATDQLKAHAGDVAADFQELRKDVAKFAGAVGKAAKARADEAGRHATKLGANLRTQANDGATQLGQQVRTRPLAAVGVSLGVGLLLGMMLSANHAGRMAREIREARR